MIDKFRKITFSGFWIKSVFAAESFQIAAPDGKMEKLEGCFLTRIGKRAKYLYRRLTE